MSEGIEISTDRSATSRRHDLDALRAFAMLLGIVLHASLAFFPVPWPVQDRHQSGLFALVFSAIHGFRMPLFFLLSGYFTMMIYRKRGLKNLISQRALRILLPLAIGMVTIIPLTRYSYSWAMGLGSAGSSSTSPSPSDSSAASALGSPLVAAIRRGDHVALAERIDAGDDVNAADGPYRTTPLTWACLMGDHRGASMLIDAGADVRVPGSDGSTPLHTAAFLGNDVLVALLVEHGADANAIGYGGAVPLQSTEVPEEATQAIVQSIGLPRLDSEQLATGRQRVREILEPLTQASVARAGSNQGLGAALNAWVAGYASFLNSDAFRLTWGSFSMHLFSEPFFEHLWFLWFLCWMVAGFALAVRCGGVTKQPSSRSWAILFVLATALPQAFMGSGFLIVGPDTSMGLLPHPHLLLYYGLFFAYGASWFDSVPSPQRARVHSPWWLLLTIIVLFPMTLLSTTSRVASTFIQPLYTWTMCFGLIGLFQVGLSRPRPGIRYLSDASYWLYLMHLPLLIFVQGAVRNWDLNVFLKFLLVTSCVTLVLLLSYHILVRPTLIGWVLNGPRKPAKENPPPTLAADSGSIP